MTSSLIETVILFLFTENKMEGTMSFISHIKEEFQVIQERDPAIKTPLEVLLYPSFRVMIKYRRAHKLYLKGHYFLARWISQRAARKTGM